MLRKLLLKRHAIGAALFPAAAAIGSLSLDDVTLSAERADGAFLRFIRSCGCGLFFLFLAGCFRLGCSLCLGRFHLLQVGIGKHCHATIARIRHHLLYDFRYLGLQFLDELLGIVCLMFDVAQFLLPDTRQFTAFQQFLMDEVDEFDACRGGDEALPISGPVPRPDGMPENTVMPSPI